MHEILPAGGPPTVVHSARAIAKCDRFVSIQMKSQNYTSKGAASCFSLAITALGLGICSKSDLTRLEDEITDILRSRVNV